MNLDLVRSKFEDNLEKMIFLSENLPENQEFYSSLLTQFTENAGLSSKQWHYIDKFIAENKEKEPLYGDFDAIQVMFRIAGEHLKYPKIRLVSKEGRYVQLNFLPETQTIKVFVDGWQGHGKRQFCGLITDGMIVPKSEHMNDDVKLIIQEFALDPQGVAKAMSLKLGCCTFCGRRLSDPISKRLGYGKTCAKHFNLSWS